MKPDPILEELWRIKEELAGEMAADQKTYLAKMEKLAAAEEKVGRKVIRSAAELREFIASRDPSVASQQ